MADKATRRIPTPPVIWWLIGTAALCVLVMWGVGGLSRTLWWLVLLVASVALAVVTLWIRDSLEYESGFHTVADLATWLFWLAAAFIFAFGVLVTGKTILGPLFSLFGDSGRYSEDSPENWRR